MAVTHPNPHGHRARLCLRIATLAAAFALVAPAATATATDPTPATGRHCAVELTQPAGGGPATIASETCFSTFAEALAFSTGGRVKVAPDIDPASLTSEIMDVPGTDGPGEAAVLARWSLGWDWKGLNYSGESRNYYVDGANPPCANGVVWLLGGVLDAGWNNVIRSAQGWSGCNHFMHYDLANQQGAVWACVPNCPNMGAMDRRTTSLKWFQ
jgi:hypothetical protein